MCAYHSQQAFRVDRICCPRTDISGDAVDLLPQLVSEVRDATGDHTIVTSTYGSICIDRRAGDKFEFAYSIAFVDNWPREPW